MSLFTSFYWMSKTKKNIFSFNFQTSSNSCESELRLLYRNNMAGFWTRRSLSSVIELRWESCSQEFNTFNTPLLGTQNRKFTVAWTSQLSPESLPTQKNSSKHTEDSCCSAVQAAGLVLKGKTSTGETQHLINGQWQNQPGTWMPMIYWWSDWSDLLYVEGCNMSWAVVGSSRVVVGW